jgi:hypothetical protein
MEELDRDGRIARGRALQAMAESGDVGERLSLWRLALAYDTKRARALPCGEVHGRALHAHLQAGGACEVLGRGLV